MFFIFLFISIILLVLSIILKKIFKIEEYFGITRSRQDYFIVSSVILFFVTLIIITFEGYNAKKGFQTRHKMILIQEKMLREKKRNYFKEGRILQKEVENVDYLEVAVSSYLSEMIEEFKEVEKNILTEKVKLKEDIIRHNEFCNWSIFGLFTVDEKQFDI